MNSTPHTSHFLVFAHRMTRTRVAHVVSLACAHYIPCVVSMRACCVFDSLRLLHCPLFAVHLLSCRPVFPPSHQLHLPRCGGQIPCALQLMRTLALMPSTTLSKAADAVSACTQVKMEDAHKLLKIPESECPDIWIRLPRHKWPKSWSSMGDPVVLLERNLYGHLLAGLLWETQFEKKSL